MSAEVLREYLISLGFSVDQAKLKSFGTRSKEQRPRPPSLVLKP
jgi:hypothetical protein